RTPNMPHSTALRVCRKFSLRCEASRMSCVMSPYLTAVPVRMAEPRKNVHAKRARTIASRTNPTILLRRRCSGVMTAYFTSSLHFRRGREGVERGRRGHGPFQAFRAFPGLGRGHFALAAVAAQDGPQEQQLRQAEPEGADGGHLVEGGELRGVVGIAARHARQAQEVHGEER